MKSISATPLVCSVNFPVPPSAPNEILLDLRGGRAERYVGADLVGRVTEHLPVAQVAVVAPRLRRPARDEERVTQSGASLHQEPALVVVVDLVGRAVHQRPECSCTHVGGLTRLCVKSS